MPLLAGEGIVGGNVGVGGDKFVVVPVGGGGRGGGGDLEAEGVIGDAEGLGDVEGEEVVIAGGSEEGFVPLEDEEELTAGDAGADGGMALDEEAAGEGVAVEGDDEIAFSSGKGDGEDDKVALALLGGGGGEVKFPRVGNVGGGVADVGGGFGGDVLVAFLRGVGGVVRLGEEIGIEEFVLVHGDEVDVARGGVIAHGSGVVDDFGGGEVFGEVAPVVIGVVVAEVGAVGGPAWP